MKRYVPYTERHGPAPDTVPECTPTFTLEHHIASLRDGNPERWSELNREWNGERS